jgi:hypothetical protein
VLFNFSIETFKVISNNCFKLLLMWVHTNSPIKETGVAPTEVKVGHDIRKIFFGMLITCLFLVVGMRSQGASLINGDFEDTPVGDYLYEQIAGWRIQAFGGAEATFSITDEVKYSGEQSLQIDIQVVTSKINQVYVCNHYTAAVTAAKGDSLSFRFYIKSQTAGRTVQARIISSDNTLTVAAKMIVVTDMFAAYEITAPILQQGDYGIRLDFGSIPGKCWLDNVKTVLVRPPPIVIDSSTVYVCAEMGSDSNPGSLEAPFRTINRATQGMNAGGTCLIRKGVYYEEILLANHGIEGHPITISAYNNEEVVVSGADRVTGTWEPWSSDPRIWRVQLPGPGFTQLFMNGTSMSLARWPDMEFHDNWIENKKWGYTGTGTTFGRIQNDSIALLNVDLTGGTAFLKIGKGNGCYSRTILEHSAGSATFEWDTTQFIGTEYTAEDGDPAKIASHGLEGNRFFVTGKLGLLDAPAEWYYDTTDNWLYFYPPGELNPNEQVIEYKARDYGINLNFTNHIQIRDIIFRGCNLEFRNCSNIIVNGCKVLYPAYRLDFFNRIDEDENLCGIRMEGRDNLIKNSEVAWADERGILISGPNSMIDNCVVHNCNLHGRHPGAAISLFLTGQRDEADTGMTVSNSTVFNCGGVGIYPRGTHTVKTTKINSFNNGIYCVDVSGYYIPYGFNLHGSELSYCWFHNMDGIGTRCDSKGREILVHHNLVWSTNTNCKWEGHSFDIYNNSYLSVNPNQRGLMLVFSDNAETDLPNFNLKNNLTLYNIFHRVNFTRFYDIPDNGENFSNNIILQENELEQTFASSEYPHDWQLNPGTRPIDAGVFIPGITGLFTGIAPDAGAIQSGVKPWVPGANWLPDSIPVPESMSEADVVAGYLRDRWTNDLLITRFRVFANTGTDVFPLQGAKLKIGNQISYTDHNGQVMVYLEKGDYGYQVGKWNRQHSDSVIISHNGLIFSDTLNYFPSALVIEVLDPADKQPVRDATITLDTLVKVTDQEGKSYFPDLPVNEYYTYTVIKDGYVVEYDSIYLQSDTLVTVMLEKLTSSMLIESRAVRVFPNPVNEMLQIEALQPGNSLEIWDLTGRMLFNKMCRGENYIDVSSFPDGTYILIVRSRTEVMYFRFVRHDL